MKRQDKIWVAALLALAGGALILSNFSAVSALILALVGVALIGVVAPQQFHKITRRIRPLRDSSPLGERRSQLRGVSANAKQAMHRAQTRGGGYYVGAIINDIGMIALENTAEGRVMHKVSAISKDYEGARPFLVLKVDPSSIDRTARLRFELVDQSGRTQYVHETALMLREGEMNILPDSQLPLMGNENVAGVGDWDLRLFIDGELMGLHTFALAPSLDERQGRTRTASARPQQQHYVTATERLQDDRDDDDDSAPMSIEDLLKQQERISQNGKK